MKNLKINRKIYACLLVLAVCIATSCKKQGSYTFAGDSDNRVFISTGNNTLNGYNGFLFSITQTPLGSIGTVSAAFPVRSTMTVGSDLSVSYKIDTALVTSFNAAHGTTYLKVPSASTIITTANLTIPQGKEISKDSIKMSISPTNLFALPGGTYLIPIRITTVSGDGNTFISSNENVAYIIIKSIPTNLYNAPIATDMTGTVAAVRTGWTATLNEPLNSGTLANMFDASTTTLWYITPPVACSLIVNMAASKTAILGVRIHTSSTSYSLTSANVYTSADGNTWTSQGAATLSTAAVYQYIRFYTPVTAQYIRLDITGWKSTTYIRMTDFNIYQ